MKLNLSQIQAITHGAVRIEETDRVFTFHRFEKWQQDAYLAAGETDFYHRCNNTAGVRMAFRTNATGLSFDYRVHTRARDLAFFDVYENGAMIAHVGEKPATKELVHANVTLAEGESEVEVYFPWSAAVELSNLEINGDTLTPIKRERFAIHFGDSITQGYDADYPSLSYASRLGRMLHFDALNKAIGGDTFCPDILLTQKEDVAPDLITVSYGTNDWSHGATHESLRDSCRHFCERLRALYPTAKIFVVSPIWRYDSQKPTVYNAPAWTVHAAIAEAVEGIDNLVLIRGWDLVPHLTEFYSDAYLHPNDLGFATYAERLAQNMLSHL
jgi:hypothetical protein